MSDTIVKRTYRSPLRERQAEETRQRVLDAALTMFSTSGYGAMTMAAIAREAGVAPETIYATFGSKPALIDGLIDRALPKEVLAGIESAWSASAGSPGQQLGVLARGARGFWERNEALAAVLRRGTGDAEIGGVWQERSAARREVFGTLIGSWEPAVLRPGVSRDEATDVAWCLLGDESYHLLVVDRGWTPARWETWLAEA